MTSRTPRNRAARAAALAALTLGVAGAAYALPAPSAPEVLGRLFPAPGTVSATLRDTTPVLDIRDVDSPPQLVNAREVSAAINAAYPPALRAAGQRGIATVEMVVRVDGTPRLAEPSPNPHEFETAARRAALQMRFRPARKGGAPVAARVRIPISFEPEGPETSTVLTETVTTVRVDTVRVPPDARGATTLEAARVPADARGTATLEAARVPADARGATTLEAARVPAEARGTATLEATRVTAEARGSATLEAARVPAVGAAGTVLLPSRVEPARAPRNAAPAQP